MKKILWCSDSPIIPTGYAQVTRNVGTRLKRAGFDFNCLGFQQWSMPISEIKYQEGWLNFPLFPVLSAGEFYGNQGSIEYWVNNLKPNVTIFLLDSFMLRHLLPHGRGSETILSRARQQAEEPNHAVRDLAVTPDGVTHAQPKGGRTLAPAGSDEVRSIAHKLVFENDLDAAEQRRRSSLGGGRQTLDGESVLHRDLGKRLDDRLVDAARRLGNVESVQDLAALKPDIEEPLARFLVFQLGKMQLYRVEDGVRGFAGQRNFEFERPGEPGGRHPLMPVRLQL